MKIQKIELTLQRQREFTRFARVYMNTTRSICYKKAMHHSAKEWRYLKKRSCIYNSIVNSKKDLKPQTFKKLYKKTLGSSKFTTAKMTFGFNTRSKPSFSVKKRKNRLFSKLKREYNYV